MILRRLLTVLLAIAAAGSLNGCGFKDIDKRFFVVAMAVDPADNPDKLYKVTVKLAIPSPSERFGSNDYTIVSEETDSIAEAVRVIKSEVDKELDLGHMKAIVIGQKLVEQGNMNKLMDWFIRRRDIQNIAWIAAGNPSGKAVLDLRPHTERLPSNMLFMSFGQFGTETAYIVSEYLFDFHRRLKERGLDPLLPIIEVRDNQQVSINRSIILDKERQRIVLQALDNKVVNSFYQGIGKYDIRVDLNDGFFIIAAENCKGTFTLNTRNGKAVIHLYVRVNGIVEESTVPLSKEKLSMYERAAEQQVNKRVLSLFYKLQQAKVDPIGFGLRYRARHTGNPDQVWRDWLRLYPEAEFKVQSKVKLMSTGQIE
ncbi:Ger(x)C family spore germination protein [Cohnella lubricantis]|uniref:Ger(X)C family spore germination protein n=1 Tax=Cohnella lubricantis TaxID=2163172 RepID=A0A841TD11_9BACL|nr:Ger(x)C family spore germination protein [Cohnella lubricantis]MBB6678076.1 Ger(x)C family spore germination protein [Cohnella lubricantis]MBP2120054.1 spore germination protein KC [Cohnella lubricantis]